MSESPGDMSTGFAGRYTLERELGRGATAIVYLAHDQAQSRQVAIKMLRPELAESMSAGHFLEEIRRVTAIRHPHIAPVLDSGESEGTLYCVLPFMEGGTLRDRLTRERQLPLSEAIDVAEAIGSALDAVHAIGLIHRDVKPENILFSGDTACLSDFGIARAIVRASGDTISTRGILRGTPGYMSPEQASGDVDLDGRSDVYSLACVVYEMIAGMQAFVGPTPQSIIAQHATHAPRPVRVYRAGVSAELQAVLDKAFVLSPADRYRTAGEFVAALRAAPAGASEVAGVGIGGRRYSRSRIVLAAALLVMVTGGGLLATPAGASARTLLQRIGFLPPSLDTLTYAVLVADSMTSLEVAESVRGRLRHWTELHVADPAPVSPAGSLARVARGDGAGRYVHVHTTAARDSLDVSAQLYDTRSGARLSEVRGRLPADGTQRDSAIGSMADALLLDGEAPRVPRPSGPAGTRSLAARQAFLRGHAALEHGAFARADSLFFVAKTVDPEYTQAYVWLANVRSWMSLRDSPWRQLVEQAERASAKRGTLAPSDSVLLVALRHSADARAERACPLFEQLTLVQKHDFAAWYGYGNCLRRDSIVVRDAEAEGGWRFRSSYTHALRAYETSFGLSPSVLRGFGGHSLIDLQQLLFTSSGGRVRRGRARAPDRTEFRGIPVWRRDSLAFVAIPLARYRLAPVPAGTVLAAQRQRERFLAIARMWRSEFKESAEAAEAVGTALELLGNASSADTFRMARSILGDTTSRLRIAATEVFVRLKFALPADTAELWTARTLADSLLTAQRSLHPREPVLLAALAALTGRAGLAARFAVAFGAATAPAVIATSGPQLLAFASLGGPRDTLIALEQRVDADLRSLPSSEQQTARSAWLVRSARLAFPGYAFQTLADTGHTALDLTFSVVAASSRKDTAALQRALRLLREGRRWMRPADIAMEGILPEAAAIAHIGDVPAAMTWLAPSLRELRAAAARDVADVTRAGPLVRAMVLRADLAVAAGDTHTARQWARAVRVLWSDADQFLQPTVRRMASLAR